MDSARDGVEVAIALAKFRRLDYAAGRNIPARDNALARMMSQQELPVCE